MYLTIVTVPTTDVIKRNIVVGITILL